LHGHIAKDADGLAGFMGVVCLPHPFHVVLVGSVADGYGGHGGDDGKGLHFLPLMCRPT